MQKTAAYVLCMFVLLNALPASAPAGGDEFYSGVVRMGKFYHDGRDKWLPYYYIDIGKARYDKLIAELGEADNSGPAAGNEIQVYTTMEINLKDYAEKK